MSGEHGTVTRHSSSTTQQWRWTQPWSQHTGAPALSVPDEENTAPPLPSSPPSCCPAASLSGPAPAASRTGSPCKEGRGQRRGLSALYFLPSRMWDRNAAGPELRTSSGTPHAPIVDCDGGAALGEEVPQHPQQNNQTTGQLLPPNHRAVDSDCPITLTHAHTWTVWRI